MKKRILALVALFFCMLGHAQPKHDDSAPAAHPAQPVAPHFSFQNLGDKAIKLVYWTAAGDQATSFNINPPPFPPLEFAANPEPLMMHIDVIKLYELNVNEDVPEHLIGYYDRTDFSEPGAFTFSKINDEWILSKNGAYIPQISPYIFKNKVNESILISFWNSLTENLPGALIINYPPNVKIISGLTNNFNTALATTVNMLNPQFHETVGEYPAEAFLEPGEFEFDKVNGEWILTKDGLVIEKIPEEMDLY